MIIYITLIVIMIIGGIVLDGKNTNKKDYKKIYCIICGILLVALSGLRNPYMGNNDNSMYIRNFQLVQVLNFKQVFTYYLKQDTEVVFYLVTKLITLFTRNLNMYFTICSIPLIYAVSKIIYKYSKMPMVSFLLYFSVLYYLWSLIIIRQTIAMGLIIIAYDQLIEKKYKKFVLLTILATLFHRTAIIFLSVFPLSFFYFNKKKIICYMIFLISIVFLGNNIVNLVLSLFSRSAHFSNYISRKESFGNSGLIFPFVVYTMLSVMAIIFSGKEFKKENSILFNICMAGCLLCALAPIFSEFFRMGLYFTVFLIILIPNMIYNLKVRETKMVFTGVLLSFLPILAFSTFNTMDYIPYVFFWQNIN